MRLVATLGRFFGFNRKYCSKKDKSNKVLPSTWNAYAVCQTVCTSECIILVSVPFTPQAPSHCYCFALETKNKGLRICSVQDDLNERSLRFTAQWHFDMLQFVPVICSVNEETYVFNFEIFLPLIQAGCPADASCC
jgi:hypothetical protein